MKERILEFLRIENKSSAQFATEIGVLPSSVSHILSGRNNPSLDFIMKMLEKYHYISAEWLLFGRGQMYTPDVNTARESDIEMNLFNDEEVSVKLNDKSFTSDLNDRNEISGNEGKSFGINDIRKSGKDCIKIVCFYTDNTFKEYLPED